MGDEKSDLPRDGMPASSERDAAASNFRDEIDRLAAEAREESLEHQRPASPRRSRRLSLTIWVGLFLIAVEAGLLFFQTTIRERHLAPAPSAKFKAVAMEQSCRGEIFRTYPAIAAYMRATARPPKELNELLGRYLENIPVDPESAMPLAYSTDGKGFSLTCPSRRIER